MELSLVDHARLVGLKPFIPLDVSQELSLSEVPKLQLVLVSVSSSQQELVSLHIDSVTANERSVDGSARTRLSNVPNLDVEVPASGHYEVWVLFVELDAEHLGSVARVTRFSFKSSD